MEQPFAFVRRKNEREEEWCLCCPLPIVQGAEMQPLDFRARGYLFVPPYSEPSEDGEREELKRLEQEKRGGWHTDSRERQGAQWFSGTFLSVDRQQVTVLAKEKAIDECMRCRDGGYQHFRLEVHVPRRGLTALVDVERTGGDVVSLRSPWLSFSTDQSFAGVSNPPPSNNPTTSWSFASLTPLLATRRLRCG